MRTRLVILMAAMAIIASGCFKVNFTIDVNEDGSGRRSLVFEKGPHDGRCVPTRPKMAPEPPAPSTSKLITVEAPAARAFTRSPDVRMPPSAMTGTP